MFWKRHIILCDSRIDMYCLLHVRVLDVLVDLPRIFWVTLGERFVRREDLVGDSFRERLTLDIALYQDYFDCIAAIDCHLMSL